MWSQNYRSTHRRGRRRRKGVPRYAWCVFAEFETNLRRERNLRESQQAKAKGVYKGRKPSIDVARVKALRDAGKGPAAIAKELKMARSSVYRVFGVAARQAG